MTDRSSIWSPELSTRLFARGSDAFRVYRIDLSKRPQWTGEVKRLRLDPTAEFSGVEIEIDYIRFMRSDEEGTARADD